MLVFVLSELDDVYKSNKSFFGGTSGDKVIQIRHGVMLTEGHGHDVHDPGLIADAYASISYQLLAAAVEHGGPASLRGAIGIVDVFNEALPDLSDLNPISESLPTWPSTVAMLVLAFPEIHWAFTTLKLEAPALVRKYHVMEEDRQRLLRLRREKFTPLFDAAGLRNMIRKRLAEPGPGRIALPHVLLRDSVAAAVDDETGYAYFVAYAAYRSGFRVHAVTSHALLLSLFGPQAALDHMAFTLEDLSLSFPDRPKGSSLQTLQERDVALPGLCEIKKRVFVTYGYSAEAEEKASHNPKYLALLNDKGVRTWLVNKPVAGICKFWSEVALHLDLPASVARPPAEEIEKEGHGVPGRLLLITETLIARAAALMKDPESVEDCIQGAVLAGDALELLGNRIPTTAIEALTLKHELEVSSECMFLGLRSELDVKLRLKEIARDVGYLAERFDWKSRKIPQLDTELGVMNRVTAVMRDNDRFDEDHECVKKIHNLRWRLQIAKAKWTKPLAVLERWLLWYALLLLGGISRFLVALFVLVCTSAWVFHHFTIEPPTQTATVVDSAASNGWPESFYHAIENFVSAHPPDEVHAVTAHHPHWFLFFIPLMVLLGFLHLGIFVAFLYSAIIRR